MQELLGRQRPDLYTLLSINAEITNINSDLKMVVSEGDP